MKSTAERFNEKFPLLAEEPDCSAEDAKPAVLQFIEQEKALAVAKERERLKEMIKDNREEIKNDLCYEECGDAMENVCDDLLAHLTPKE
jgi:hypothetical protein